jgi:hypothetical protein
MSNVLLILTLIIIIPLIVIGVFKLKQPFWSRQPVFHLYNLTYWFMAPGIIQHDNVKKGSRYFDPKIHHGFSHLHSEKEQLKIVEFIKDNYVTINEDGVKYSPTQTNIFSYLNTNSILSIKYDDYDEKNKIIGCISGRPIVCFFKNIKEPMHANYVDYLCVHKNERNQGIAPKLIYSYYHHQRGITGYKICLFKKEGTLTSIIPLCTYLTYGFHISGYTPPKMINVQKIKNKKLLYDNLMLLRQKFDCVIIPNINDFISINDIHIYGIVNMQQIYCLFFFRTTYSSINGIETVECFASINNTDNESFYQSFLGCIMTYFIDKILIIEDISDNTILVNILMKHLNIIFKTPTGYYFYNYGINPIVPNKLFIVN